MWMQRKPAYVVRDRHQFSEKDVARRVLGLYSQPTTKNEEFMRAFLIFLLLLISGIVQGQTTAITDPRQIKSKSLGHDVQPLSIEKLYMTRAIGGTTWSPDGKQVAFVTNISGRNNIWIVSAEGGWPVQLTVSDQRQIQPTWSSDGRWIAYSSDYDGNEQWDMFVVSPQTGEVVNLTNTPEIAEQSPTWSYDGKSLAY